MIVSRPFQDAVRGVGRNALDLPVAALAALAAAFVAFALPGDLLADMVGASGLPSLIAAAEPPLGLTARIAIGAAGAALTFGLVILLLRWLDRSGLDAPEARAPQSEDDAPRLRRRDAHPDAPGRRPISAARDLGEPAPPVRPRETRPAWLAEADPSEAAVAGPESEPAPEPVAVAEPLAEPVGEPASSLAELMARLERGLARRSGRPAAALPHAAPQVFPEAGDDRLQSALDSLQRLAARQS
jgi:hypothetical protein